MPVKYLMSTCFQNHVKTCTCHEHIHRIKFIDFSPIFFHVCCVFISIKQMECYYFIGFFFLSWYWPCFARAHQLHHRFHFAIGVIVSFHENSRMAINKIAIWFDSNGLVSNIYYFYSSNEFEWRWRRQRQHVYDFVTRFFLLILSHLSNNQMLSQIKRIEFSLFWIFSACSILTWAIVASMIFGGNTFLWRKRKEYKKVKSIKIIVSSLNSLNYLFQLFSLCLLNHFSAEIFKIISFKHFHNKWIIKKKKQIASSNFHTENVTTKKIIILT